MHNQYITDRISEILNGGFSFGEYISRKEREEIIFDLVHFYDTKGYGAYEENDMVYVIDNTYKNILMMEVTRNSIYFNPYSSESLFDVIYITLEFISEKFGTEEHYNKDIEDQETEDAPKPKPNFDIL